MKRLYSALYPDTDTHGRRNFPLQSSKLSSTHNMPQIEIELSAALQCKELDSTTLDTIRKNIATIVDANCTVNHDMIGRITLRLHKENIPDKMKNVHFKYGFRPVSILLNILKQLDEKAFYTTIIELQSDIIKSVILADQNWNEMQERAEKMTEVERGKMQRNQYEFRSEFYLNKHFPL